MSHKKPLRSLALVGYPSPGREIPWMLEALWEIERLTKEHADQDLDFANSYNAQEHSRAVSFAGRLTDGPCTIAFNIDVDSVTRNGAGIYDIVFDVAAPDSDYLIQWNVEYGVGGGVHAAISARTTTGFRMTFYNIAGGVADPAANVHLTVLGHHQ